MKDRPGKIEEQSTATDASAELMVVRCANCGEWMDVKPGRINFISHGLCDRCYEAEMRKLARDS